MLESGFRLRVCARIKDMFPGCIIIITDPTTQQGIPDRIILWHNKWAALEFKQSRTAKKRPNQDYYVDIMDRMSFAAFIYPENEEEVLRELELAFTA